MAEPDTSLLRATLLSVVTEAIQAQPSLKSGDGGGTSSGMEARVARLESDIEHVKKDVAEVKADMKVAREQLTTLVEQVRHLPSKGFIFTVAAAMIAVASGVTAIITKLL